MPEFTPLTAAERDELNRLLASGQPLPESRAAACSPIVPAQSRSARSTNSCTMARPAATHVANENFNPDYHFVRVRDGYDVLEVEVKQEGDDSNRNRAKCRDGTEHFAKLNRRLGEAGEPWRYHFFFLLPEDYPWFFDKVCEKAFAG